MGGDTHRAARSVDAGLAAGGQRAERLASTPIEGHRISYGYINEPVVFCESFIQPIFVVRKAIVHVLPDVNPLEKVFGIPHAARPLCLLQVQAHTMGALEWPMRAYIAELQLARGLQSASGGRP